MYEEYDETTGLTSGIPQPTYSFESSVNRRRKHQIRRFQCCVCVIFLSIIALAIIISIAFNINASPNNDNSTTNDTDMNFYILINKIPLESNQNKNPTPSKTKNTINENQYNEAINAGKEALKQKDLIDQETPELDRNSPSYKHQKIVYTSCKAAALGRIGYAEENAAKHLREITKNNPYHQCSNTTIITTTNENFCSIPKPTVCDNKYRTFDGSCNNLRNPSFGMSYRKFRRLLKPTYGDGISSPRRSIDGSDLPSARTISLTVHRAIYKDDPDFTIMLAVFGQFLDHDITATALNQGENGRTISCCSEEIKTLHPECYPVILDEKDPNFIQLNVTCMEFLRSLPAPTCCLGMREQMNQATSYLDASVIYGDLDVSKSLRSFSLGRLKMFTTEDGRDLLPPSGDLADGCNRQEEASKGRYCFATGDGRANENLHLTSMHLLWARQHNRVVRELHEINPHWDDERLFLEGRKIIGAQLAHITYNEFLPILLGGELMGHFDLWSGPSWDSVTHRKTGQNVKNEQKPRNSGYFRGYDDTLDVTVANVFASAAFRFAHTLIPSLIRLTSRKSDEFLQLRKILLDPFKLYDNGTMDGVIVGAARTKIEANDAYFSHELKQHMFSDFPTTNNENDDRNENGDDKIMKNERKQAKLKVEENDFVHELQHQMFNDLTTIKTKNDQNTRENNQNGVKSQNGDDKTSKIERNQSQFKAEENDFVQELKQQLLSDFPTFKNKNDQNISDNNQNGVQTENGDQKTQKNATKQTKLCGLDLVSLNIQRGRDHGLPGYASWRERCGLRRPRSFHQLEDDIDDESLARIGSVYKHVDDIDLYTGAISERPIKGGFLGPTLTCLILDQFVRLKKADRFWYENPGQFNVKQLQEIRKSTLARIICDNSDGVTEIQPEVMKKARLGNRPRSCDDFDGIPRVDFGLWQELKRVRMRNDEIQVVTVRN